uniref:DNA-directed DNA polymerase n=1 Tax=Trichogramma kaykai TaxID=54128 RepID=A0ABD2WL81_9HYME
MFQKSRKKNHFTELEIVGKNYCELEHVEKAYDEPHTSNISSRKNKNKENVTSDKTIRQLGSKHRAESQLWDSFMQVKKLKSPLSAVDANQQHENYSASTIGKFHFSGSYKNKSNTFSNVTSSFISSKILSLPVLGENDAQKRLELSNWGLTPLILEKYHTRGLTKMFPWQVECLANKKILLDNKNLVYSAPTSAGKTLVSELLILKTVLERRKKVIFILPFVSVVREKMFYLQDLLSDSGVRVEGFMGGVAPAGGFQSVHIAIATIEKANSLINRLMQDGDLDILGAVVIDELHLLGDPGRGYILELLLTKLKYMSDSFEHIDIQLIGMSATLPNLPLIADWLNAELYHTDFRPIPLEERCKIGLSIMNKEFNLVKELIVAPDIIDDSDNVIQLCIETISTGRGTLIFCPTKNWCEKLAVQMAATFFQLGHDKTTNGMILRNNIDSDMVQEVLAQLEHSPVGLDSVLKKTISFGVAFHHAGLTMDERDIIEGAFRTGSLKVLVATSTLSSGVNLPARRVIIRSPMFNGNVIDKLTYQQMIGRAGRMGKDTAGESILICKHTERSVAEKLIKSTLEPIKSCLKSSGPLIRALLEAIASQVVKTPADLDRYSKCTFIYKCEDSGVKSMVEEAVEFLVANEFLLVKNSNDNNEEQRMMATCLGKACLSASIPPRDALFLFEELQRARKCFVLDTELHVVYLVTPFNSSGQINQIDWMSFMEQWRKLSESERRVGNLVGVEERFIMSAMRGIIRSEKTLSIHRRFFTALALHDLVREVPLNAVCRKYNCSRGLLQSLQQSSATFSGMVTSFCKELKWDCMELLFAQFQTRLQFGVQRELLDLLRLPSINGLRARSLFKHGITTVGELVLASEIEIEEALEKALPFESEKDFDGGNKAEVEKKMKMRTIFITGKDGLTAREAARIVINEARLLVKNELGLQDVKWSQNNDEGSSPTSPSSSCFSPTAEAMSLQPLSLIQEVTSQQPNTCIKAKEEENNLDSEVKTGAIEAQTLDKSMKLTENNDAKQVTVELQNKLSLGHVDNRSSGDLISQDIINQSDKEQPEKSTRTLRSRLTSKNKSVKKNITVTNMTTCTADFQDDLDSYFVESSQNTGMTLKSKISAQTARIVEKMESLKKSKQISICSVDFQDSKMDGESVLQKVLEVHDNITVENINFTENNLSKNPSINQEKCLKLNSNVQAKNVTLSSRNLRSRTINIVESDDNHRVTHDENLKVKNQKSNCKVELENNLVSIRSIDFQDSDIKQIKPTKQDSEEFRVESFLNMSSGTLNELLKSTNKKTDDADKFQKPTSLLNYTPKVKEKKRESASSINSSKSMSLFSDSSFLDAQICSVLEKNVIEGSCLIDFENSEFNQNQHQSQNVPSSNSQNKEKNLIISSPKISNINAVEDLLFSPRKFRTFSKEKGSSMQQQIRRTEDDQSKNIRTEGDQRVSKKTIIASDSKENSPTVTRSKYIFARKLDEPSPIAGIRSYNKRVPITTAVGSSPGVSDSDESIVNSQVITPGAINKTRNRLLVATHRKIHQSKTSKKLRDLIPPIPKTPESFYKRTSPALIRYTDDSDNFDNDSDDLFESENIIKPLQQIAKCEKPRRSVSLTKISLKSIDATFVANSQRLFKDFRAKIEIEKRKEMAVAMVTESYEQEPQTTIGNRIVNGSAEKRKKDRKNETHIYANKKICGIVFSWGVGAVFYMAFENTVGTKVTIKERISFLRDVLQNPSIRLRCFNVKEVFKMLCIRTEIEPMCRFLDPRSGDWLMNSEICQKSYSELTAQYFSRGQDIAKALDDDDTTHRLNPSSKAAAKALLAWYLTDEIMGTMKKYNPALLSAYKNIEMPTIVILAKMELRGFGINSKSLLELASVIKQDLARTEETAFHLAGRKFNFYSPKDVSQVLGLTKKGRKCTNKNALKSCDNPLSNLITIWRKLSTVQTKIIFPLLQLEKKNGRIHGQCITYTVTGRISMHEPNLQTIPRDFKSEISGYVLSPRMAFIPSEGNIMLSADFCQLELRILAHFSKDPVLCELMLQKNGDIFKNIAARLNNVAEEMVDDDMRQRAKQLCYAMIYGMGAKSLAETLSISESDAKDYLETFMSTYKGIKTWLKTIAEQARIDGFVNTITGRKRVLPNINSNVAAIKSQAERQAVNTKVQGSAADIAKKAMVLIEDQIGKHFSRMPITPLKFPSSKKKLDDNSDKARPNGGFLILQLHDELIYEVNPNDLPVIAKIVKESMERAFQLRVPLPVKVKIGTTWGNLEEYKV